MKLLFIRKANKADCEDTRFSLYSLCRRWAFQGSYGDIFAVSTVGKIITMVSAIFGIAVVALPAGIITAGYIDELNKDDRERNSA